MVKILKEMDKNRFETFDLIGTEVISNDIFQDRFEAPPGLIEEIFETDLPELWVSNPDVYEILKESNDMEEAREKLFDYLDRCERKVFELDNDFHLFEKATIRQTVGVLRSIFGKINEERTKCSALKYLYELAQGKPLAENGKISKGFVMEFIHLFRGIAGLSGIYSFFGTPEKKSIPVFISKDGREAAVLRSQFLDEMAEKAESKIAKYKSGLEEDVIQLRKENKNRILKALNGSEEDWNNYKWHLKNVFREDSLLEKCIHLSEEEKKSIQIAVKNKIPFGITPFYVSLMEKETTRINDHAVRAQVIPPLSYSNVFSKHRQERHELMDFMGEHDTSPVDLITRRYPEIVIIKAYNTCSQICVYCQRNWEIEGVLDPKAKYSKDKIENAVKWIKEHNSIRDVLITGGDPFVLSDNNIRHLVDQISEIDHVLRIRIGSRIPVVLPQRITDSLCDILGERLNPGHKEISIVTHFEHCYEITPEAAEAVNKLKSRGISVYNQQVFTYENSRRFETVALRRNLKLIGVDPYYSFMTKGKEETEYYRVPIARIMQERKEEARLFPGLDRTDEPVFNVPRLGKNHLRAMQDHRLVMILPDGRRVYEFHSWEKFITPIPPYNFIDVPIYNYLQRLKENGEDISEYKTIWYYY